MRMTYTLKIDVDSDYELISRIQSSINQMNKIEVIQVVLSSCNTQALIIYKKIGELCE